MSTTRYDAPAHRHLSVCMLTIIAGLCLIASARAALIFSPSSGSIAVQSHHGKWAEATGIHETASGTRVQLKCSWSVDVMEISNGSLSWHLNHTAFWGFDAHSSNHSRLIQTHGSTSSRCSLVHGFASGPDSTVQRTAEMHCESDLLLENLTSEDTGLYSCQHAVQMLEMPDEQVLAESVFNDHVRLVVVMKAPGGRMSLIVTILMLVILAAFLVAMIIFRLTGHRFHWQSSTAQFRQQSFTDSEEWHRYDAWRLRSRNHSVTSGIVFQANPESMAKLMDRLKRMDESGDANEADHQEVSRAQPPIQAPRAGATALRQSGGVADKKATKAKKMRVKVVQKKAKCDKLGPPMREVDSRRSSSSFVLGILPTSFGAAPGLVMDSYYDDLVQHSRMVTPSPEMRRISSARCPATPVANFRRKSDTLIVRNSLSETLPEDPPSVIIEEKVEDSAG